MARNKLGVLWFVVLVIAVGIYNLGKHESPPSQTSSSQREGPIAAPTPLFTAPAAAPQMPSPVIPKVRYVTATSLNVRASPDTKGRVLLALPKDSKVATLAAEGDWFSVKLTDGSIGWISAKFVTDTAPRVYIPVAKVAPALKSMAPTKKSVDRNAIIQAIIAQSMASTGGSCPCPFNRDRAGRQCGRRSAYSRPGGASPICYVEQVTDQMIKRYTARN